MSRPFFSIVIPTYNRSAYLSCAIQGILNQKERDIEIIVSDNCSEDDTEHIVSEFHSSKIHYFRNKKNIGWIGNLRNAILHAKGKYIFLHGDDDYVFDKNCLSGLHKQLIRHPIGFVRLNYLTYTKKNDNLFDVHHPKLKEVRIKSKTSYENVMSFIQTIDPFFITGQIFFAKYLKNIPLIQSEYVPWFSSMFEAIYTQGAIVSPKYSFVASWSQNDTPRYKMINGEFSFEQYYKEVKKRINQQYYEEFLNNQLDIVISEFPAAKYYLKTTKFWHYAVHVLDLDKTKKKSIRFWFYLFVSLCTPKCVLSLLKRYAQNVKTAKCDPGIYDSIAIFRRI